MSSGEESLTQDVVFDVLSSARRRYVLHLLKTEGEMELTELAEHVAAQENDTTVEELTKQQRKRVYVSLYQTHVPKLEDAGLVEYDQETSMVELRSQAADIDQYLGANEQTFPWQYVYLALAAIGLGLVLLSNADIWIFGAMSQGDVAITLVVGLLLVAAIHVVVWTRGGPDVISELRR